MEDYGRKRRYIALTSSAIAADRINSNSSARTQRRSFRNAAGVIMEICPVCSKTFAKSIIEVHVNECLETHSGDDVSSATNKREDKIVCPVCSFSFPASEIDIHVDACLSSSPAGPPAYSNNRNDSNISQSPYLDLPKTEPRPTSAPSAAEYPLPSNTAHDSRRRQASAEYPFLPPPTTSTSGSRRSRKDQSHIGQCPVCFNYMDLDTLEGHINTCLEKKHFTIPTPSAPVSALPASDVGKNMEVMEVNNNASRYDALRDIAISPSNGNERGKNRSRSNSNTDSSSSTVSTATYISTLRSGTSHLPPIQPPTNPIFISANVSTNGFVPQPYIPDRPQLRPSTHITPVINSSSSSNLFPENSSSSSSFANIFPTSMPATFAPPQPPRPIPFPKSNIPVPKPVPVPSSDSGIPTTPSPLVTVFKTPIQKHDSLMNDNAKDRLRLERITRLTQQAEKLPLEDDKNIRTWLVSAEKVFNEGEKNLKEYHIDNAFIFFKRFSLVAKHILNHKDAPKLNSATVDHLRKLDTMATRQTTILLNILKGEGDLKDLEENRLSPNLARSLSAKELPPRPIAPPMIAPKPLPSIPKKPPVAPPPFASATNVEESKRGKLHRKEEDPHRKQEQERKKEEEEHRRKLETERKREEEERTAYLKQKEEEIRRLKEEEKQKFGRELRRIEEEAKRQREEESRRIKEMERQRTEEERRKAQELLEQQRLEMERKYEQEKREYEEKLRQTQAEMERLKAEAISPNRGPPSPTTAVTGNPSNLDITYSDSTTFDSGVPRRRSNESNVAAPKHKPKPAPFLMQQNAVADSPSLESPKGIESPKVTDSQNAVLFHVVALYDYQGENMLEMIADEKYDILEDSNEHYYYAQNKDMVTGFILKEYCRVVSGSDQAPAPILAIDILPEAEPEPEPESSSSTLKVSADLVEKFRHLSGDERVNALSNKDKERQYAIFELIDTWTMFVEDIYHLINSLVLPLKESNVIAGYELKNMFANIEAVFEVSAAMNEDLVDLQKSNNFVIDVIGDKLKEHFAKFFVYAQFCANIPLAMEILKEKSSDNEFVEWMMSHNWLLMDINTLLLKPMQRILKLPLLVREIFKRTPESHPDHWPLKEAQATIEDSCNSINTLKRIVEDLDKSQFDVSFITPSQRTLVSGGLVTVLDASTKMKQELNYLIYNDVLILLKDRSKNIHNSIRRKLKGTLSEKSRRKFKLYCPPLWLSLLQITEEQKSLKLSFLSNDITLVFEEATQRVVWLRSIQEIQRKLLQAAVLSSTDICKATSLKKVHECWKLEDTLYVATESGIYESKEDPNTELKRNGIVDKKTVYQMEVLNYPEEILIVLLKDSEYQIVFYSIASHKKIQKINLGKKESKFFLFDQVYSEPTLVISSTGYIEAYQYDSRLKIFKEMGKRIEFPRLLSTLDMTTQAYFIGYDDKFGYIDLETGSFSVYDHGFPSNTVPSSKALAFYTINNNHILFCFKNYAFEATSDGYATGQLIPWTAEALEVALMQPYLLIFTQNYIEVRDMQDCRILYQIISAPNGTCLNKFQSLYSYSEGSKTKLAKLTYV